MKMASVTLTLHCQYPDTSYVYIHTSDFGLIPVNGVSMNMAWGLDLGYPFHHAPRPACVLLARLTFRVSPLVGLLYWMQQFAAMPLQHLRTVNTFWFIVKFCCFGIFAKCRARILCENQYRLANHILTMPIIYYYNYCNYNSHNL